MPPYNHAPPELGYETASADLTPPGMDAAPVRAEVTAAWAASHSLHKCITAAFSVGYARGLRRHHRQPVQLAAARAARCVWAWWPPRCQTNQRRNAATSSASAAGTQTSHHVLARPHGPWQPVGTRAAVMPRRKGSSVCWRGRRLHAACRHPCAQLAPRHGRVDATWRSGRTAAASRAHNASGARAAAKLFACKDVRQRARVGGAARSARVHKAHGGGTQSRPTDRTREGPPSTLSYSSRRLRRLGPPLTSESSVAASRSSCSH